jgi:hypothetical protein
MLRRTISKFLVHARPVISGKKNEIKDLQSAIAAWRRLD